MWCDTTGDRDVGLSTVCEYRVHGAGGWDVCGGRGRGVCTVRAGFGDEQVQYTGGQRPVGQLTAHQWSSVGSPRHRLTP